VCYTSLVRATLTIRLGDDLIEALTREARQSGLPKGEIVRQAIATHLRNTASTPVMARYFGTMRGPANLSTNKAYRRAWTKKRR
jgi:hypothetical protein